MSGTSGPELPGYVHVYSGKVRDLYAPLDPGLRAASRGRAAVRGVRPDLGLRRHPGDAHP